MAPEADPMTREEATSFRLWLEMAVERFDLDMRGGNVDIDADHRYLLQLALGLNEAVLNDHPDNVIESTVTALRDYVRDHFAREETLMTEAGYPGLESHRREHRLLAAACDALTQEYHYGRRHVGLLHRFLRDFVLNHVPRADQALTTWLRAKANE